MKTILLYQKYLNYLDGKKILVIGKTGFLSSRFKEWSDNRNSKIDFLSVSNEIDAIAAGDGDNIITKRLFGYDIIINAAGNTKTKELDSQTIFNQIAGNVGLPASIAEFCRVNEKQFCHISSACIYKSGSNVMEDSPIACSSPYYCSKYLGDCLLQNSYKDALILRPRLLFDDRKNPKNLLDKLSAYDTVFHGRQSVTSTDCTIAAAMHLLSIRQSGIYNVAESNPESFPNYFPQKKHKLPNGSTKCIELNLFKLIETGFEFENKCFERILESYKKNEIKSSNIDRWL